MLEQIEALESAQYQRKKADRFRKELAIIDKINESDEYQVVLEEYDCIVTVRDRDYKLIHNADVVSTFKYLDDLAEYVVRNFR
jgi:uncharacterized protein YacL